MRKPKATRVTRKGKAVALQPAKLAPKAGIQLEPHRDFKKAIVGTNEKGWPVYSFYLLIQVLQKVNAWDPDEALEWLTYNIEPLAPMGFQIQYEDDL